MLLGRLVGQALTTPLEWWAMKSFAQLAIGLGILLVGALEVLGAERPNVLWIIAEDMSPHFGCYGERSIQTPNVDRLAKEGTLFRQAYVTAPICSTSRSALITGMYQTSIGAQHHRSGRGTMKIELPNGVVPVPELFRRAGYWTCNGYLSQKAGSREIAKTDYNFEWNASMYDGNDWAQRAADQPFFAQIQLHGGKVRDGKDAAAVLKRALGMLTDPSGLQLPPYYPKTTGMLDDWGLTLDACRLVDLQIGQIRERLEREGLLNKTVIFFITDHGVSHARGKQFLYDEGTRIPCVVRGPGVGAGVERGDLVEHIDLAASSLAFAGIAKPEGMQSQDVFSQGYKARRAVFAARDRADETVDRIRSVRTEKWLYVRNYLPERPHLQPNHYKDHKPCLIALRAAEASGELNELQRRLLFAPSRPAEELYDLKQDPNQVRNLAAEAKLGSVLDELRGLLREWEQSTGDRGRQPESEAMYDSDMAEYLGKRKNPEIEANISLMKRWAKEGK
jgi:arylsulfatase A-like enzyme